ncbi:MAG: sel1 repeat family protein [Betaproteobacteria bacterium]|nr:MAG: sel1 repeat family protein [Betaproteobacteria bacterium]
MKKSVVISVLLLGWAAQGVQGAPIPGKAYSIATDGPSVSTFSSEAMPRAPSKDPAFDARTAFNFFDYSVARRAWEPMAEAGLADAQFGLYQIHSRGLLVDPDSALAMHWLLLAAPQGHAGAQFHLGLAHLRGEGVEHDIEAAWVWFSRAEAQGYSGATRARVSVERRLTASQLTAARLSLAPR